jgi:hypothetical protein
LSATSASPRRVAFTALVTAARRLDLSRPRAEEVEFYDALDHGQKVRFAGMG